MVAVKQFSATANRENGRWWVVDVEGVGVTQGRTTVEAERMASGLIEALLDLPPAEFTVDVIFYPPGELAEQVREARAETERAAEAQRRAAEKSRAAVRSLLDAGMSKQDAARILKVAPQRISQLVR
jgi:hypothetical protein